MHRGTTHAKAWQLLTSVSSQMTSLQELRLSRHREASCDSLSRHSRSPCLTRKGIFLNGDIDSGFLESRLLSKPEASPPPLAPPPAAQTETSPPPAPDSPPRP